MGIKNKIDIENKSCFYCSNPLLYELLLVFPKLLQRTKSGEKFGEKVVSSPNLAEFPRYGRITNTRYIKGLNLTSETEKINF